MDCKSTLLCAQGFHSPYLSSYERPLVCESEIGVQLSKTIFAFCILHYGV